MKNPLKIISIAFLIFGLLGLLPAQDVSAEEWLIDPNHSAAHFSIEHLGIAMVRGSFADLTGTATIDEKTGKITGLRIVILVKSIDTGVTRRDDHLRSDDFFAAVTFPLMTFTAKEISEGKYEAGKIVGDLSIKGTTREVIGVLYGPTETITDPWGHMRKGGRITATIDRTDFGITYNNTLANGGLSIGNTVEIVTDFEIFLPKKPE
jgi:polyisoprenoid-binding protein YceI